MLLLPAISKNYLGDFIPKAPKPISELHQTNLEREATDEKHRRV
jgi:hypothetical protein